IRSLDVHPAKFHNIYAIKNGREPSVGKYPHLLSLQEEVFLVNSLHVCSAVLIHPQWALSSAHCFRESESNMYHVMSGVHQLLDNLGEEWEQDIEVSNYTLHKDYIGGGANNHDIAIIRLAIPARIDNYTTPVVLPPLGTSEQYVGRNCSMVGWGDGDNGATGLIHEGYSAPMTSQQCDQQWTNLNIREWHLCTGGDNTTAYPCSGDGGSPLTCPDDSGNLVLAGLGSFTPYPCSFYPPAVFTRITYYRDWICDVTYRDVC
ncbi:unnamed protein product, partial [Owenia fusiformis]